MWHRELRIDVMTTLNKKKPSLIISKMKDSKIWVVLAVLGIHYSRGRHLLGPGGRFSQARINIYG